MITYHRLAIHSPKIAKAQLDYYLSLRHDAQLERDLAELAILRVAHILKSEYVWAQHLGLARKSGLSQAAIEAARDQLPLEQQEAHHASIIRFVDAAVPAGEVDDACFEATRAFLSPQQIVELTLLIAAYVGSAIFTRAMRIPVESAGH